MDWVRFRKNILKIRNFDVIHYRQTLFFADTYYAGQKA